MVKFSFNLQGWAFRAGVSNIILTYDAARSALDAKVRQAQSDIAEYEKARAEGAPWEGEVDEDGHVIWAKDQLLDFYVEDAAAAMQTLRHAFAIMIYHLWERHALSWIGTKQETHDRLVEFAISIGYPIDPGINELRLLVNLLKHSNPKWGRDLHEVRKDMFSSHFDPADTYYAEGDIPWRNQVFLEERHMVEFINTLSGSGPSSDTLRIDPEPTAP